MPGQVAGWLDWKDRNRQGQTHQSRYYVVLQRDSKSLALFEREPPRNQVALTHPMRTAHQRPITVSHNYRARETKWMKQSYRTLRIERSFTEQGG